MDVDHQDTHILPVILSAIYHNVKKEWQSPDMRKKDFPQLHNISCPPFQAHSEIQVYSIWQKLKDVRTQTGTIYDKYHLPPESIRGKKIIRSMKVAARVLFARLALKKADLGSQVVVFLGITCN